VTSDAATSNVPPAGEPRLAVGRLAFFILAAVLLLISCGGEAPVIVWLARHGSEVSPEMGVEISKCNIGVGMPIDAVEAIIATLGCKVLERKNLDAGMTRIVYRLVRYDTVGKAHTARVVVLFRQGYVTSATIIPEN